ncbi:hypothetical protein PV11_00598 [Exophiala sideris]|uniref:Uncharacterized protein n=1 Tax=Exophiala sideris TaxID=1016849 RepID=A0A0D1YTJ6_9EURO|nr:hypothetical protein PV11_00598 [Exophiala sideris]
MAADPVTPYYFMVMALGTVLITNGGEDGGPGMMPIDHDKCHPVRETNRDDLNRFIHVWMSSSSFTGKISNRCRIEGLKTNLSTLSAATATNGGYIHGCVQIRFKRHYCADINNPEQSTLKMGYKFSNKLVSS